MDEKNRNKLDILYIQFLNFSIFPHLYSIYTPSSANSANFTNIGFHKARVFRSNIPLTFDSSDTKKYPSSRIMAFEAELSFLACPDPRKRKGRGKNIYPHTFSVQREIIQRHVVPRQALKSFHGTKPKRAKRFATMRQMFLFGRVLSSCKWRPQRNAFPSMEGASILLHQSPLSIYQRTRVFLRAFTIHTG